MACYISNCTSLIGILVFSAATQAWFINKLRWFEIIIFLIISLSFLSPEYVLNKFYPKFNYLELEQAQNHIFEPNKEVHIKITRQTEYGDKYKLFVINKNTYEENFNLENYGINLVKSNDNIIIDTLNWKGNAKKSGLEMNDIISEIKIENFDRPNKDFIYIFAFIALILFGFLNYKNYRFSDKQY